MEKRGYSLKPGDHVVHKRYPEWGVGKVLELWRGNLPGGRAYVKVIFEDGKVRIFDNSVDSSTYWGKVGIVRIKKGD
jgi:hypothetical protein